MLELKQLLYRNTVGLFRNPGALTARVSCSVFICLITDSIYYSVGNTANPARYNTVSVTMCMFFICIAQLINATGSTVMEFNKERTVFMREIASSLYNVYPYYFSK